MKQEIRDAVLAIAAERDGKITPDDVIAAAEDPMSPLHAEFTWDDTKAAHSWRVAQARQLIRSVVVRIETTRYTMSAPAFVRDPTSPAKSQGYASLVRLRGDEDQAREAVLSEFSRASQALTRAKAIAAALNISEAEIERLVNELDILRSRVMESGGADTSPQH